MKQGWRVGVIVALVVLSSAELWTLPASAAVTGISPGTVTIDPGGGASATVSVMSNSVSCLTVRSSSPDINAEVSTRCDAEDWRSTLSVSAAVDTPAGTYTVRVVDQEGGEAAGRTLTVRVRDTSTPPPTNPPPPPPTTASTSTTRPTTTTPPSTTTSTSTTVTTSSTSTTETPTTTTTPPSTTTSTPTAANTDPVAAFASVSSLVALGIPADGVFVPLTDPSFRNCLPLRAACGDPASGLVIVPARTTSMRWEDPSSAGGAPGLRPLDLATPASSARVAAIGEAPAERAGTALYALPAVEVSGARASVGAELRSLDVNGQLVPAMSAPDAPAALLPVAVGPLVPSDSASSGPTFGGGVPFGRPTAVRSAQLTEGAPAIVLVRGTGGQVLHGIRPDPSWNAGVDLVPLFAEDALPYLVRGIDGPPGLFIARPADMRVEPAAETAAAEPLPEGNRSPIVVLAGTAVLAAVLTAGATLIRRRSRPRQ